VEHVIGLVLKRGASFWLHIHAFRSTELPTRLITLGDIAFPLAAARAWNALPATIRSAMPYHRFISGNKAHTDDTIKQEDKKTKSVGLQRKTTQKTHNSQENNQDRK